MNALVPIIISFILMFLGYRFYSKYIADKVLCINDETPTPAVTYEDGMDYLPTHKSIVFNHHFASIAGLSPILGPALAVIWGWVPVVAWLVIGSILLGAVHDFCALVLSVRNKGKSIGEVADSVIGKRAKVLFLLIMFFAIALAMGAFTKVVASLLQHGADIGFKTYPAASFPAGMLMIIAMICGVLMRKKILGLLPVSIIGTFLTFVCIWLGQYIPIYIRYDIWIYILLVYAFIASVLPVWLLLQPRDFINAFALYIGMILMYSAAIAFSPKIVAPAINPNPTLPSMIPLLFITVACGAISGFHSLVASGTTAKQLAKESDARPVGYGAMLAEGALGIIAVMACCAGFATQEEWLTHYADWGAAKGLGPKLSVFVQGAANFVSWLGIPLELALTFVALIVVSFALTTLDSGTRILRYNTEELMDTFHLSFLKNRFLSSAVAIAAIWFLATQPIGKDLWLLFGTTNQLLAGLVLLTATVYLISNKRNSLVTAIPMLAMLAITLWALLLNLGSYISDERTTLIVVSSLILLIALGIVIEVILFFSKRNKQGPIEQDAQG
ncbi:carbon starvation protein A [bacterium]|nr:carbon starvation protein A [bacterium]